MSWKPDHPGGIVTCDRPGCARSRRYYCEPHEAKGWTALNTTSGVRDLCPQHRGLPVSPRIAAPATHALPQTGEQR